MVKVINEKPLYIHQSETQSMILFEYRWNVFTLTLKYYEMMHRTPQEWRKRGYGIVIFLGMCIYVTPRQV